jgi:phosphomannomutase
MKNKFIFDVDGTLTPSRGPINEDFKNWFIEFCAVNEVYLVTGSDYSKTLEQLGEEICNRVALIYNCSGNDIWAKGKNIKTSSWTLPQEARQTLETYLSNSKFVLRTGNHIEERPGAVNFSIVGRNATLKERAMYKKWDDETQERHRLALEFNHCYRDIEARVGGETGIDIYPKGQDKGQILKDFDKKAKLFFFGDRCEPGGNDYPLSSKIKNSFHVKGWVDTWERLQYFSEARIVA